MNLYDKYILPKYLDWSMRSRELFRYRHEIISQVSGSVLEVGFGSGLNLPYYHDIVKLYALDPSKELYDLAQDRLNKVSFPVGYLNASAENIPLADDSVDFTVSTWSLCSILHLEIALKEIFRVLRPNGRFVFIEHGKSPQNLIAKLQNLLTPISMCLAGGCHMNRDIEKNIFDAGFEMEKLEKFSQKFTPLDFVYKGVAIAKK